MAGVFEFRAFETLWLSGKMQHVYVTVYEIESRSVGWLFVKHFEETKVGRRRNVEVLLN